MPEYQATAPKIESTITGNTGRSVHTSIGIDGHNDETQTSQAFREVGIASVAWDHDKARWTRSREGVLNVNVEVLAWTSQPPTGGMIAVQQHKQCMRRASQIGGSVDPRP
jgi:hypothetical protein